MNKYRLVYEFNDARISKKGWTYILLSKDRRLMKIGSTLQAVEARVIHLKITSVYRECDLDFYLAAEGVSFEHQLQSWFGDFRAKYKWIGKAGLCSVMTSTEVKKEVRRLVITEQGKYSSIDGERYFRNNITSTKLELFKIPPVKIGKHIGRLVSAVLEKHNGA